MNNYSIDRRKWQGMSTIEQMGNIYSEVGRSFTAKKQHDTERSNQAMYRAIDLFDATVEVLIKSTPYRAKEVLRSKDQYLQVLLDEDIEGMESLDRYFMYYAIAARR